MLQQQVVSTAHDRTFPPDSDNTYYDLAQNLRQRITDMKIKIDRQLRILAALKDRVKDQVVDMQRLEVRRHNHTFLLTSHVLTWRARSV